MVLRSQSPSEPLLSVLKASESHVGSSGGDLGTPCHPYTTSPESAACSGRANVVKVEAVTPPSLHTLSAGNQAGRLFTQYPCLALDFFKQSSCLWPLAI